MNGTHICTTCRRKISAKVFHKYPSSQWTSLAAFVSLSAPQIPKPVVLPHSHRPKKGLKAINRSKRPNSIPNIEASRDKARGDLLEALFVDGLNISSGNGATATLKPNTASLELYEHVEKLMEMLNDSSTPIPDMWALFTQICPKARPRGSQAPYSLHFAAKSLLRKLLTARQQPDPSPGVPTMSEIARAYASLSLLQANIWNPMLETFFTKESADRLLLDGDKTAEDLLETWQIILSLGHNSHKSPGPCIESPTEWYPPALNPATVRRTMQERGIEHCFALLLPKFRNKQLHGLVTSAVTTFAMLTSNRLKNPIPFAENNPFLKAIAGIIVMAQITPGELEKYFRSRNVSYGVDLNWPSLLEQARSISRTTLIDVSNGSSEKTFRRFITNKETRVFRLLHRALAAKDLDTLDKLWLEVQSWPVENDKNEPLATIPAPSPELCNQFIGSFMELQKERAVDVWNFMVQSGVHPTVLTWHAMLEGCKSSRDAQSLLAIWHKLINSDTSPDVECWTTLISGLFYCGDLEGGLRAFVDMRRVWETAAKRHIAKAGNPTSLKTLGDTDGAVKPTTAIINATIAGLLRKNRTDIASQVLTVGGEMGITPDNITYNTMLRSLVRNKDDRALTNLLEQMQSQGVQGDVATFTIILENALSDAKNRPPHELIEIIKTLFAQMDASDVKPNLQTYAAIVNSILRRSSGSEYMAPVNFVLEHMSTNGLQPSAHINTMIVDFYFKQSEPQLDAIGVFLDKMMKANSMRDHIFWDRVIEGYSYMEDTVRALQYLRQTQKEGFMAGYFALDLLIHALVRSNEVELAIQLVSNTRIERGGPPAPNARGVDGQHQFWNSATEMGLTEEGTN